MTEAIPHHPDMDAAEILRLYATGQRLPCRYCKVELKSIPEQLASGEWPIHLTCPNNPNHISLHADPARGRAPVRPDK
ncbi:hypothetical protein V1318_18885 [Lysobacter sp. CCNWLW3]|uniref:hypothetical protein n=1 Tax=unclassified Lysobacter TaxID=2635362 RepID=UPI002FD4CAD4